jgi:V/A-type H+-transporting ATPase subunit F
MKSILLGEEEVVLGFSLVGIDGSIVADAAEASRALERVLAGQPRLIFVTERVAASIEAEIRAAVARGALVQVIPGPGGAATAGAKDPEAELLSALGVKLHG